VFIVDALLEALCGPPSPKQLLTASLLCGTVAHVILNSRGAIDDDDDDDDGFGATVAKTFILEGAFNKMPMPCVVCVCVHV
jgi:hypothetical protein